MDRFRATPKKIRWWGRLTPRDERVMRALALWHRGAIDD
jgi:hypothetical protein